MANLEELSLLLDHQDNSEPLMNGETFEGSLLVVLSSPLVCIVVSLETALQGYNSMCLLLA